VKAKDIVVLPGSTAIRRRPAVYLGQLADGQGQRECLQRTLRACGEATTIHVELREHGFVVSSEGPGLSVRALEQGLVQISHVFEDPFDGSPELAMVVALTRRARIASRHEGRLLCAELRDGVPTSGLREEYRPLELVGQEYAHVVDVGPGSGSGRRFDLEIDPAYVPMSAWQTPRLEELLEIFTTARPQLTVHLGERVFHQPDGLVGWVTRRAGHAKLATSVSDALRLELAVARTDHPEARVLGLVNERQVGGPYLAAMLATPGLVAAIHVRSDDAHFFYQELVDPDIEDAVAALLART
jgi:hypothetical protein